MAKSDKFGERIDQLEAEYRALLVKALRECAAGQWGLFGHNEHLITKVDLPDDVANLMGLAELVDGLRRRIGQEPFPLHQQFQAARGRAPANAAGEPKQAQAWLAELGES